MQPARRESAQDSSPANRAVRTKVRWQKLLRPFFEGNAQEENQVNSIQIKSTFETFWSTNVEYYPMWWEQESAIKDSEGHLKLVP